MKKRGIQWLFRESCSSHPCLSAAGTSAVPLPYPLPQQRRAPNPSGLPLTQPPPTLAAATTAVEASAYQHRFPLTVLWLQQWRPSTNACSPRQSMPDPTTQRHLVSVPTTQAAAAQEVRTHVLPHRHRGAPTQRGQLALTGRHRCPHRGEQ